VIAISMTGANDVGPASQGQKNTISKELITDTVREIELMFDQCSNTCKL